MAEEVSRERSLGTTPARAVRLLAWIAAALAMIIAVAACGDSQGETPELQPASTPSTTYRVEVTSPAFDDGETIPVKYTCDGEDVSPTLSWRLVGGSPAAVDVDAALAEVATFALIVEDPDAPSGVWTHWIVYDIPAEATGQHERVSRNARLGNGGTQGSTDFGGLGYDGPCPPSGAPHRYFFKMFAVARNLELGAGVTRAELMEAMEGSILYEGQLIGLYGR